VADDVEAEATIPLELSQLALGAPARSSSSARILVAEGQPGLARWSMRVRGHAADHPRNRQQPAAS
jgi:hypothetical protein